jgi:hypothetical protein
MATGLEIQKDQKIYFDEFRNMTRIDRTVKSGCAVTPNGSQPPLKVDVASGVVNFGTTEVSITGTTLSLTAADPSLDRMDLVVSDIAGTLSVLTGTPAALPHPPAYNSDTYVVVARVLVEDGATSIGSGDIKDLRVFNSAGVSNFIDLSDTPSSYSGEAYSGVRVNSAANALEFVYGSQYGYIALNEAAPLDGAEAKANNTTSGPTIYFEDAVTQSIAFSFKLPEDVDDTADLELEMSFWGSTTEATKYARFQHDVYYAGDGEDATPAAVTTTEDIAVPSTLETMEIYLSSTLKLASANVDAGDVVRVVLSRLGGHANDTFLGNIHLTGLRYRYTRKV